MTLPANVTKSGSGKFVRQGHTDSGTLGSDVDAQPIGSMAGEPKEVKPNG